MRLAATSDLHGFLPPVPPCDVLVIAGDIAPVHDHDVAFQAHWLDTAFRRWLEAAPAAAIVGIAGNHDFVFERAPETVPADLPWRYLQDNATTVEGVTFWGSPWTPWFYDWAFNAPRDDPDERFLEQRSASAPAAADVLVVHGPPAGYGDLTTRGARVGSAAFTRLIDRLAPELAVYGHIHEGRGTWQRSRTMLANVAAVDANYRLVDEPMVVFDL